MSDVFEHKVLRNVVFLEARARGVQDDLIQELSAVFRRLVQKVEQATTFDSKIRAQRIVAEIHKTLDETYSRWGITLTEETRKAVETVIASENTVLVREFKVSDDDIYQLPLATLETIVAKPVAGGKLSTWTSKFSDAQTKAIKRSLFQSVAEGLGGEEAARRLRTDEALFLTRRDSDVLARTSMLQASSDARGKMLDEYKKYIPSYRYLATLDSRTCLVCAPYDGRTEKRRRDLPSTPRHPRCRCTVIAWDRELVEDDDIRPSALHSERKVNHRDGSTSTKFKVREAKQVNINTSYSQWFKKLSEKDQLRILGPTRFKYYKEGRLELNQYATPNRIKTVDELREIVEEE